VTTAAKGEPRRAREVQISVLIVGHPVFPAPEYDANPFERQRSHGGVMSLAAVAELLVIASCPHGLRDSNGRLHAAGLILVSPFTSMADLASEDSAGRFFPMSLFTRNKFETVDKISLLHMPLFMVIGTDHQDTPPWMARSLMARANEPKQLYVIPGAGHNDTWQKGGADLIRQITAFVSVLPS